ncbi:hypothetical protein GYMLUDRAFT_726054 [Collybiopsis luxurians FD-317 M1]|nr:hypothetical protein GYMLUDRAFT_726054 [Collybiopsis luxurians FD-317 M1]
MTVSFSLTGANATAPSIRNAQAVDHNFPVNYAQRLCCDLPLQHQSETDPTSDASNFVGDLYSDTCDDQDLPPRPESRLDFIPSYETQLKASRSHGRSPSATLRWTREILKKIRMSASGSSWNSTRVTSDSHARSDISAIESSLTTDVAVSSMSTPSSPFADEYSHDVGLSTTLDTEINPSVSNSSSLSSSSSNSWPPLDNINVSFSSSSDLDDDTDEESDSDLHSLKEIDLGDGLVGDETECIPAARGKQACTAAFSHVPIYGSVMDAASTSPSSTPSSISSNSDLTSEPFPAVKDDTDYSAQGCASELPLKYTCLPSPLSLFSPCGLSDHDSPLESFMSSVPLDAQPPRHLYTHRGHSRHALHYRKWFWALREDNWTRYTEWVEAYQSQQEAYTGVLVSPDPNDQHGSHPDEGEEGSPRSSSNPPGHDHLKLFPSLFSRARDTVHDVCRHRDGKPGCGEFDGLVPSSLPPMSIHPRWGDLVNMGLSRYSSAASYADTWCLHTDRYLLVGMSLGLWTIRKVLWLSELNSMHDQSQDRGKGEQTSVAEESKGSATDSDGKHPFLSDDGGSSFGETEDDDLEEGQVMCSSVVSLASVISAAGSASTSDSDDSDVTLVENDSDVEAPVASSSSVSPADAPRSGRSLDFDRACSFSCGSVDDAEDFEEVDLGLGCSSLTPPTTDKHTLDAESTSKSLFQTLYHDATASTSTTSPASTFVKNYPPETSLKGKKMETRSWYEQCELLLMLTSV